MTHQTDAVAQGDVDTSAAQAEQLEAAREALVAGMPAPGNVQRGGRSRWRRPR
ncbi:hypothetical protein OG806_08160 [Streptomyces sp. NBC_00882]|uniref:hypothetical protein n=1 Tax=Streptomyces TaxID=1883 RepID=UPI0038697368|nr:hypothetical protein OG806_08160 [Streptomyces sp. NBC_00882]WSZ56280.1 hypothetical protein OH824_06905 [Streptomyces canus]